jgi:hypothetical protein
MAGFACTIEVLTWLYANSVSVGIKPTAGAAAADDDGD